METTATAIHGEQEQLLDEAEDVVLLTIDATEIELENLLFGNDSAFLDGLKSHEDINHLGDLGLLDVIGGDGNDGDELNQALGHVEDADVRLSEISTFDLIKRTNVKYSCLLWTLSPLQPP